MTVYEQLIEALEIRIKHEEAFRNLIIHHLEEILSNIPLSDDPEVKEGLTIHKEELNKLIAKIKDYSNINTQVAENIASIIPKSIHAPPAPPSTPAMSGLSAPPSTPARTRNNRSNPWSRVKNVFQNPFTRKMRWETPAQDVYPPEWNAVWNAQQNQGAWNAADAVQAARAQRLPQPQALPQSAKKLPLPQPAQPLSRSQGQMLPEAQAQRLPQAQAYEVENEYPIAQSVYSTKEYPAEKVEKLKYAHTVTGEGNDEEHHFGGRRRRIKTRRR